MCLPLFDNCYRAIAEESLSSLKFGVIAVQTITILLNQLLFTEWFEAIEGFDVLQFKNMHLNNVKAFV